MTGVVGSCPALAGSCQSAGDAADLRLGTRRRPPWLTADRGWAAAGDLRPGERVVTLGGTLSVVAWVHAMAGHADMYNLTDAEDHTFSVGQTEYVVYNTCDPGKLSSNLGGTKGDGLQAQHVIPCELVCSKTQAPHQLMTMATNWDQNAARNGILLPIDPNVAAAIGTVTHNGSHQMYTAYINDLLDDAFNNLPNNPSAADIDVVIDGVIAQGKEYMKMVGDFAPGIRLS